MITQDLGIATAYGYAKSKGYTGTEAEFAELMASYASTAQTAIEAADRAVEANTAAQSAKTDAAASKTAAQTAAQTATSKASEAVTAADTATTKASEASQSASTASAAATSASTSAQTATTAATTATTKASEAGESATTASTAKTDAETARDAAAQSASEAAASAASIDPETLEHKAYGAYVVESTSGAIASFDDGADNIPMKDVLVHIEPVQTGSGDPSPDNVRPITGWTGAKVTRTGKNLLPYPFSDTTKTVAGITFTDLGDGKLKVNGTATDRAVFFYANHVFKPIPSGDYILSRNTTVGDVVIAIDAYNGNTWVKNIKTAGSTESSFSIDYDGYERLDIFVYISAGQTVSNDTISLMIRLATETDATFTPYSGQTYDITFPSEAGTVYGGTLDVTGGVLTVDRASVTANNNINVTIPNPGWRNQRAYGWKIENAKMPSSTRVVPDFLKCSHGSKTTMDDLIWNTDMTFRVALNSGYANMPIDVATTGEAKQWLIDNNVQLVYELATPITYTLTPQEITSLLGTNNLWADTGNSDVEYRADAKMYVDAKVAAAVSALS